MRPLPILPDFTRLPLGGSLDPFPSGPPSRGRARQTQAPAKPQEEPPYPYDKVPPAQRGRPARPTAPHHLPTYPKQPFSGLDGALQNEGTADHSAASLPLASPLYLVGILGVWGREVPGPRAGLAQGTGGVGLAWGSVPLALGAADTCRLVGGWKLAGDDPRLGHFSFWGCQVTASTQVREGYRPVLGTGAFQRPWTEALGWGDGEAVKTGYGRPSPSTWEGEVGGSLDL